MLLATEIPRRSLTAERRASAEAAKTVQEAQRVLSLRTGRLKTSGRMSRALDHGGSVLGNSVRTCPQDLAGGRRFSRCSGTAPRIMNCIVLVLNRGEWWGMVGNSGPLSS